ncbi:transcription factor bHLH126-like isoform X2 [Salvia miltiorrhiza]|uniref:transcription factor bHLH126-like isoform X2 n=1 Tax=Salvia miltiorrhiza TaxID=226208 RepID=UPI0025ABE151|nr:transcription factor bHLH126-like isoform X2 [Salvia miltiorrhiza]
MLPISSDGVSEDPSIFLELEDLLADCPIPDGNQNTVKKSSASSQVEENNQDSKKTAHRFTERQRRQEMSALYASLRSLLPLQYVKKRRDKLRNITTSADPTTPRCVKINLFKDGMEILITHSLSNKSFPLSKVLAYLLDRQLNVVHCVSTTTAPSTFLQTIHIELNDSSSVNLPELQERLDNLIRFAYTAADDS